MRKVQDLNWFEIWEGTEAGFTGFHIYSPTAPVARKSSLLAALEWVANQPDPPKKGADRGPIRHARHIAKCLLLEMEDPANA